MKTAIRTGCTTKTSGSAARTDSSVIPSKSFLSRFSDQIGSAAGRFVWMDQIHGSRVRILPRLPAGSVLGMTDGCVTTVTRLVLCIRSADCVPLLLYDTNGRAVGAVHAGWKGLLRGIVGKGVRALCRAAGCRPAAVRAVFGPSIQMSCYEVGEEIRESFIRRWGLEAGRFFRRRGKSLRVSLQGIAVWQLKTAGLAPASIRPNRSCTACSAKKYYSYRARGEDGRIATYIFKDR